MYVKSELCAADTETAGEVQYAVKTGDTFPENYLTVPASSTAANEKGFLF